jgi:hypothetical protein
MIQKPERVGDVVRPIPAVGDPEYDVMSICTKSKLEWRTLIWPFGSVACRERQTGNKKQVASALGKLLRRGLPALLREESAKLKRT